MLNCEQAAKYLNMAGGTFQKERDKGRLPPAYKPTEGRYLWDEEDLKLFNRCGRNMSEYNKQNLIKLSETNES